jgi:simple sugar transport system substrate-binding protein
MNARTKRFISVFATLLVVMGLVLTVNGQVQAQARQKFVLVSHGGPGNAFWITVIKGMEDAGKIFNVDVQWLGDPVDSIPDMPKYLEQAIAANPDGLGITAPNPDLIRDGLVRFAQTGKPIIIFNTDDKNANDPDKRLPYMFYIGTTGEFPGGQGNARAALAAAKAAGVKINRAVCPIQEVGHSALEARCAGYTEVMKQAGVEVDKLTTMNDINKNAAVLTDYFKAHPETNAINTLGPNPAAAFYLWAKDSNKKPGDVFHTSHDTSPEIFANIQSGLTVQTVDQEPYYQGFGTVEWLWLNANYKLAPAAPSIPTGPTFITAKDIEKIIDLNKAGYR